MDICRPGRAEKYGCEIRAACKNPRGGIHRLGSADIAGARLEFFMKEGCRSQTLDFLQARCHHARRSCEHHPFREDVSGASTHTREAQAAAAQWLQLPGPPRPERICVPFAPHGLPQFLRRDRALPGYLAAASDIFCSITDHARLEALPLARFSVDQCALLCLPEHSSAVDAC